MKMYPLITTNNVPRQLVDWSELTDKEKENFDYMDDPECGNFVRYKNWCYDLGEFTTTDFQGWDGIHVDSFFSGVLIKWVEQDEVVMATVNMISSISILTKNNMYP
jgi:hypothetical protein